MKNYRFLIWFLITTFFDMRDKRIKMTPTCSPRRARTNTYFLTLKDQFENLTSGQVKVRSRHVPGSQLPFFFFPDPDQNKEDTAFFLL